MVEHRTAWIVASLSLLIMLIAAVKPDLFEAGPDRPAVAEQQLQKVYPDEQKAIEENSVADSVAKKDVIAEPFKPAVIDAKPATKKAVPVEKKVTKAVKQPAVVKTVKKAASGYYIQLGAFNEKPRAQGLVDQLRQSGWHGLINEKSTGLFAVWAGPESNRKAAETLQQAIERKLKLKGFIIHHKAP
ncbi:rare lipoprotein A [Mariprofundus micogutta]|uniref:Rare lipoprotein A n=2 Tax=Mariprofundus micogutta TaxID=1921010 RepID=A0A1L8CKR3_9PROT|nr:rare lipoprotein A [Mariprofundus micogutta]